MIKHNDMTESIHDLVVAAVKLYINKANVTYNREFKIPEIHYNVTGTSAGKAWSGKWVVGFNPILLKENLKAFMNRTVPHEIAHLITDAVYNIRGHGPAWRGVMFGFGHRNPTRCHNYNTSNCAARVIKRYKYKCDCGRPHNLTAIKHNRINNGRSYICRSCRSQLHQ